MQTQIITLNSMDTPGEMKEFKVIQKSIHIRLGNRTVIPIT